MQNSNLRLETYFVESLSWEIARADSAETSDTETAAAPSEPNYDAVLDCSDIHCEIERAELESPRRAAYRLKLNYAPQPEKSPYAWSVALIGHFELDAGFPEDQVLSFMDAGAPAMLYGAAREALASALGRGPYVAPLLPTVHFANLQPAPPAVADATEPVAKPKRIRKKKVAPVEVEAEESE